MTAHFGQFLDHDITLTPEIETQCCIEGGGVGWGRMKRQASFKEVFSLINNQEAIEEFAGPRPTEPNPDCFEINIPKGDSFFTVTQPPQQCLAFARSDAFCNRTPREQYNAITAFVDGSNIYGSDANTANNLRYFYIFAQRSKKF